jgi:L-alanine-DL-glutamate epimerase-like enolase superfamily enzyme
VITDIRVVKLRVVEEVGTLEPAWNPSTAIRFQRGGGTMTQICTDRGLTGIGPGVKQRIVPALKKYLVGADLSDIPRLVEAIQLEMAAQLGRYYAGADIALWDLMGKACGQPLYKLWGGVTEKVPAYASAIRLYTPEQSAQWAARRRDEGWQAIKLRLHHAALETDLQSVEAARKTVGGELLIMADANQAQPDDDQSDVRWDYQRAVNTALGLQELGCSWLEEPMHGDAFGELARLNAAMDIPIAGGENYSDTRQFLQALTNGVFDIVQPDSMVMGGITPLLKVAEVSEAFGKQLVPHHGRGGLGMIAHLHLVAYLQHAPFVELLHDPPVGDYRNRFSILENPPLVDSDGYIHLPEEPGLGVSIAPDLIEG